MVMKTGREWLLVESSKLQDHRQSNCVIRNITSTYSLTSVGLEPINSLYYTSFRRRSSQPIIVWY